MNRIDEYKWWFAFLGIFLIGRIALSTLLPLTDFSEARYAEVARNILVHHDWVTLWFKPGEPFWGKPPMAFWSIAVSYLALGVSGFSARLPSLVFTLLTAALVFAWVRRHFSISQGLAACIVYLGSWLVIGTAGSVITDPLLTLSTTAVMCWFWDSLMTDRKSAPWLMWAALGVGLLAKGPLAPVLCGLACGVWVIVYRQWQPFLRRIHLLAGPILMLLIAVPWYYLAEQRTPGFLRYFIVGEHFDRYLIPGWAGDKYGGDKRQPIGFIWVYFLAAALPWSVIALARLTLRRTRSELVSQYRSAPLMTGYLIGWVVLPLVFFTFARNILITYVMASMPAAAILVATRFEALAVPSAVPKKYLYAVACAGALCFFAAITTAWQLHYKYHRYNQKPIVDAYEALAKQDPGPLIYTGAYRFSAVFYTRDHVIFTGNPRRYYTDRTFYVAIRDIWEKEVSRGLPSRCREVLHHSEFHLWYCPAAASGR